MNSIEPTNMSKLEWLINSLGTGTLLILVVTGLASFVMTLLLVRRKSTTNSNAIFFCVGLPIFGALFCMFLGLTNTFNNVASQGSNADISEFAYVLTSTSYVMLVAILLTAPSYLLATFGLFFRTLQTSSQE